MNNIKNKYNKICENKIKEVFVKSLFNSELSNEDLKILTVIERMKTYLKDYDLVEGTYFFKVFIEAFLTTKKRKKTLQANAFTLGLIEVYTKSSQPITTVAGVAAALGITGNMELVPVSGCAENGSNHTVLCTEAWVRANRK